MLQSSDLVLPRGNFDKKTQSAFLSILFFSLLCKRKRMIFSAGGFLTGLGVPLLLFIPPLGALNIQCLSPLDRPGCQGGVCPPEASLQVCTGWGQACLLGLLCPVLGIRVCEAVSLPTWQLTGEPSAVLKIGVGMGGELESVCGHKPQPCSLSCQSPYLKPMFIHPREEESLKIILENVTVSINEPNFILHI